MWADPQISESLNQLSTSDETTAAALQNFKNANFPFGWDDQSFKKQRDFLFALPKDYSRWLASWLLLLLGWAATAVATLFGAPFWFDTLQRFVQLGGTGPKPAPAPPTTAPSSS